MGKENAGQKPAFSFLQRLVHQKCCPFFCHLLFERKKGLIIKISKFCIVDVNDHPAVFFENVSFLRQYPGGRNYVL